MKTPSYDADGKPPKFQWPRFKWQIDLWLSLVSFVLGILLLFVPNLPMEPRLRLWRNVLGGMFLCAPFVIPLALWLLKFGFVLISRGLYYEELYQIWQNEHEECELFQRNTLLLLEQMFAHREFELSKAYVYQGKIYIVIKKEDTMNVAPGDRFIVVHKGERQVIGLFEVTEVRRTDYYAMAIGGMDPMWKGYVYERKEVSFFPDISAIYLPQGA